MLLELSIAVVKLAMNSSNRLSACIGWGDGDCQLIAHVFAVSAANQQ